MSTSTPIIAAEEDQTNIPLSERKLSSLTDLEILELTQSIKAADANLRPLIGELESISALSEEYEGATTYLLKIKSLEEQGWKGIRRSRGDGDCFYRSLAFCYVERLLNESTQKAKDTLDSLNNLLPLLYQANFQKDIVQDFFEPFVSLLESLGPSPSTPRLISATLLQSFNDPEISNSIVVFLRLLTSAYLRANKDDFEPFMFSLEDDPRFFEGGVPTLEMFCGYHVEASSKEADHIQITALTRALGLHTRIAYLDQSGMGMGDNGSNEVDFHEFEEGKQDSLLGALLYRPGHYDILYR